MSNFLEIAHRAGAELMRHYGHAQTTAKQDLDFLTQADLASEGLIVEKLAGNFPDHALVAEESGAWAGQSEWVWYIDPLDGTSNFLRCDPHFAVALGLVRNGHPYLGVVYNPARDQLFSAAPRLPGGEARFNGRCIQPLPAAESLATASLGTDWPWSLDLRQHTLALLQHTVPRVRQIKIRGCAALDLCDVARGVLDAYLHPGCQPWDLAAAWVVNAAAGTALLGPERPWDLGNQPIAACAPSLVEEIQPLTRLLANQPLHPL